MLEKMKRSVFTSPVLVFVTALLLVAVRAVLKSLHFDEKEELFLFYTVAELLVFVLPGIVYLKLKKTGYVEKMHLVSFGISKIPLVLLTFFVMAFGAVLINLFASGQSIGSSEVQNAVQFVGEEYYSDPRSVLYVSLALGIVPAFAEEFVFRGILLYEYKDYGMLPSIIITSLYFAMLHFDIKLFPYYFVSGMVLGAVAYTARSAFAAAVLHSLYNLFSLFALPILLNFISLEAGIVVFYLAGVFFLLFLMLALGEGERLFAGYSAAGIASDAPKKRVSYPPFIEMFSPTFLAVLLLFVLSALNVIKLPTNTF